ncbi:MAG: hypothetical protein RL632_1859 [Bacteroidota bacterium]
MTRLFVLGFFLCFFSDYANACCGAGQHRIFPLGVVKNKAVCAVFEISRHCEEEFEDYSWGGKLSLAIQSGDSLRTLYEVTSMLEFLECICTPEDLEQKSEYLAFMQLYLDSAYKKALELKGFKPFERMSYLTTSTDYGEKNVRFNGDALHAIGLSKVVNTSDWSMQCESLSMIRELRLYYLKDKCWIVCALGCPEGKSIGDNLLHQGQENTMNSSLGMTYVSVDWHGFTKDVLLGPKVE